MVKSLGGKMKEANLWRIDVGFNINRKNMNNFIGRTAHILFLQNEAMMKMFVYRYQQILK